MVTGARAASLVCCLEADGWGRALAFLVSSIMTRTILCSALLLDLCGSSKVSQINPRVLSLLSLCSPS